MEAAAGLSLMSLIIQGGSFALLTYLLVWGLPSAYKRLADDAAVERARASETLRDERKEFSSTIRELTTTFKEEARAERVSCEKHFTTLSESISRSQEVTASTIRTLGDNLQAHSERNRQWTEILSQTLQSYGVAPKKPEGK